MTDELKSPFVFVPEGAEVPDAVRGPGWIRIPATFVPRSGGGPTNSGQSWPKDRNGLDWAQGRDGQPICPLTELPPGGPVPGESTLRAGDPVATFLAMDAVFRDPARAAGLTRLATAVGRGGGETSPTGPVAPAVPDADKQWLAPTQSGKPPVYDIYIGGFADQSMGHAVLNYARGQGAKGDHNVIYFPYDANAPTRDLGPAALARYIDLLPADAQVNLIGHSFGGDTAAKAAAMTAHSVNLLVTIDPVSNVRPDVAAVKAHVERWIDVNAAFRGTGTVGDLLSEAGGPWELLPRNTADTLINAAANHEDFTKMMSTPGPDGLTPRQALAREWHR